LTIFKFIRLKLSVIFKFIRLKKGGDKVWIWMKKLKN
jgi:hypothetical protein